MRRHGIFEEEVRTTLGDPEHLEPTVKGRMNAFGTSGRRIIRVTYLEEDQRIVVVTATPRQLTT